MITWAAPTFESMALSGLALFERAVSLAPENPVPLAKLGNIHLDRYDFVRAADAFRRALRFDPHDLATRVRLARCLNELGHHDACIALLAPEGLDEAARGDANVHCQRATALIALGQDGEADLRAALARRPDHAVALTRLAKLLRKAGRYGELVRLCDDLAAQGIRNAQLLLEWGRARALTGDIGRARNLLFDHDRVFRVAELSPKTDWRAFNRSFAQELISHPVILDRFGDDDANRGSRRVHHLVAGERPDLVRLLVGSVQAAVDEMIASLLPAPFDPWLEAMPRQARLHCWGLIQRSGEFENWHVHRGGWLSGVYYVDLPAAFSVAGDGAGCIEYGPPPSLATEPAPTAPLRIAPCEGMLLLAPSHYHHRTIPFTADGYRISFAFDVVPVATHA
ncbi:MAG: tetratricopeptide repeat protein [Proteobacteria bacterium]|nr:tetratricopeptide repeat protein [Pseudomonadota bacterium]